MRMVSAAALVFTQLFAGIAKAEDTFSIDIPGQMFAPSQAVVREGTTVTWTNSTTLIHTVTFDPSLARDPASASLPLGAPAFDSGIIRAGQTFAKTFLVPGEYRYFCRPHEMMGHRGTLIVTAATPRVAIAETTEQERLPDLHVEAGSVVVWTNAASAAVVLAATTVPSDGSPGADAITPTVIAPGADFTWTAAAGGTIEVTVTYASSRAYHQRVVAWDL